MRADFFVKCKLSPFVRGRFADNTFVMDKNTSARDIAGDIRHPRHIDGFDAQTMKAWAFACFFLKVSQVPGTNMPNIKDFSAEKEIKRKRIAQLKELYDCEPTPTYLLAAQGDILDLPPSTAACIPISYNELSEENRLRLHYGQSLKTTLDGRLTFECFCIPYTNDANCEQTPLETRLYWLNSCLDDALRQCLRVGITKLALPYRFNSVIDGDDSNWVRYENCLEDWATANKDKCQLIIVENVKPVPN